MNWQAVLLTLKLAMTVSVLLMLIALPLAYWLTFSRARWKFLIESVVAMPLILPPTVLGFYALVAFGSPAITRLLGHSLAFTFAGLVIASMLYSLPFAVQPLAVGFAGVDPALLSAAATLGANPWRRFARIILPLSSGAVVTALVLCFAHTVGEFGVVLMVGGNIPGITRTISIDIYDRTQEFDFTAANHTALVLLVFSFVVLLLVYAGARRKQSWRLGKQPWRS